MAALRYKYNDGGRKAAGFKGTTRDCACRAVAIALGIPYREAYDALNAHATDERLPARYRGSSHARTGYHRITLQTFLEARGWKWVATMRPGQGCTVHLAQGELPAGRVIARVSKHFCAVIDGVVHDTHDPTRGGTRCVYGYFVEANDG